MWKMIHAFMLTRNISNSTIKPSFKSSLVYHILTYLSVAGGSWYRKIQTSRQNPCSSGHSTDMFLSTVHSYRNCNLVTPYSVPERFILLHQPVMPCRTSPHWRIQRLHQHRLRSFPHFFRAVELGLQKVKNTGVWYELQEQFKAKTSKPVNEEGISG